MQATLQLILSITSTKIAEELKDYIVGYAGLEETENWYTLEGTGDLVQFTFNTNVNRFGAADALFMFDMLRDTDDYPEGIIEYIAPVNRIIVVPELYVEDPDIQTAMLRFLMDKENIYGVEEQYNWESVAELEKEVRTLQETVDRLIEEIKTMKVGIYEQNELSKRLPHIVSDMADELGCSEIFEDHMSSIHRIQ